MAKNQGNFGKACVDIAYHYGTMPSNGQREEYTQNTSQAWTCIRPDCNVMVMNKAVHHEWYKGNVGAIERYEYTLGKDGQFTYIVFVMPRGKGPYYFRNKGDGGYINWSFRGDFQRDGGWVTFY